MPGGRPTKFNRQRADAICQALRQGASRRAAAESNGIEYETFRLWVNRGIAAKSGQFFAFVAAVAAAESECEARMAQYLTNAAAFDWRAAAEWLKRRRRDDWSERQEQVAVEKTLEVVIGVVRVADAAED